MYEKHNIGPISAQKAFKSILMSPVDLHLGKFHSWLREPLIESEVYKNNLKHKNTVQHS